MHSAVEPLEGNKVKVTVRVEAGEFERDIDTAFRKIAQEVRIPGFRAGKAPRKVLEAKLGAGAGREQALRDALPEYYAAAIVEHAVDVIAPPEIDITDGEETGEVAFDAVVEVRPEIQLAGYSALSVTIPSPMPTDDEIDGQIDRLRRQLGADLRDVDRPALDGDHVTVDITTTRDGDQIDGLTADDYVYELGSGAAVPELDDELRGAKAGAILAFDAKAPDDGGPLSFRVLLKQVRELVLPALTDEWVADATEFETVQELRADLRDRIGAMKKAQATMALRNNVVETIAGLVAEDVPEAMIGGEMETRLHDLAHRLSHQGIDMAQYLGATGKTQDELIAELRDVATQAVRADLALRAVAAAEGLAADDELLDTQLAEAAAEQKVKPDTLRAQLERDGRMAAVRSDLMKASALDWLVEHVAVVDEDGNPVDRDALLAPEPDEPDEPSGSQAAVEPSEESPE